MNKAYIYYNGKSEGKDYCGEGTYALIFNDEIIARHYCSNRNFANHDLTAWRVEKLEKNNIDEVVSNGEIVWAKQSQEINKTQEENIKLLEKLDYLLDDVYSTGLVENEERNKYQYAIEYILSDYKRVLKENEELKADNYELNNRINDLLDNISVQKVKDKIRHYQELQDNYIKKYDEINEGLQAMINVLQELLEGRK